MQRRGWDSWGLKNSRFNALKYMTKLSRTAGGTVSKRWVARFLCDRLLFSAATEAGAARPARPAAPFVPFPPQTLVSPVSAVSGRWYLLALNAIGLALESRRDLGSADLRSTVLVLWTLEREAKLHPWRRQGRASQMAFPVSGPFDQRARLYESPGIPRRLGGRGYRSRSRLDSPCPHLCISFGRVLRALPRAAVAGLVIQRRRRVVVLLRSYRGPSVFAV